MNNKDRAFCSSFKKFLWPVQFRKLAYLKLFFQSFIVGINGVVHVLFLERIVKTIEISDRGLFNDILLYYFIYIISFEVVNFSIKKWGWMNTIPYAIADVYNNYLAKYIKLDNNLVELRGTGKIIGIMQNGAHHWAELVTDLWERGTILIVSILFTIFMVSRVEYYYGLLFILLVVVFFYLSMKVNFKLDIFRKIRYELRNDRVKFLVKILMNKMEILQTDRISTEMKSLYQISDKVSDVSKQMSTYRTILKRLSQFGITILILLTFWYLGNKVFDGEVNFSILVGLTGTLIIMQKAISEFIGFYVEFTKKFVNIDKLWTFFDEVPEMSGYNTGKVFKHDKGNIEIKDIEYSYGDNKPVFKNFNLELKGEKITALVGNSGSGKSTLVKLIAGYIKSDKGDIVIDGQKLSTVSLKSYYKDIGYLTQEPSVFDGSIIDNLTYAMDKKLEKKELKNIIELSKCEFVYDLPNGLDTEIGERGIRLSGGQRQRLAIAKIFLKDPKVILLDEPTSALDSFSEELITKAMHNLFNGRTIIVIAHRLQTVKHADDIILLENGKIKERGTHKELINKNGVYKKMLDLQSGF